MIKKEERRYNFKKNVEKEEEYLKYILKIKNPKSRKINKILKRE